MAEEKTEKPTARKLREARKRGEVLKSLEITRTAEFAALFAVLVFGLPLIGERLADLVGDAFLLLPRLREAPFAYATLAEQAMRMLIAAACACFGVTLAVAVLAAFLQVRGVFSLQPVLPNFNRMNPGNNLQQLFSTRNLFELAKTVLKVGALLVAVGTTLAVYVGSLLSSNPQTPAALIDTTARIAAYAGAVAIAVYATMAAIDYGHQYFEFMRQQRMSKDEVRREYREIEGDPLIRANRRMWHRSLAARPRAESVSQASVVVTNPTQLAVALGYDSSAGELPYVIAKGAHAAAAEIRRAALLAGVPVVEDKLLARRLYHTVPEGAFIVADTFSDVARALALAYQRAEQGKQRVRI
jgi:type III secretion protein U